MALILETEEGLLLSRELYNQPLRPGAFSCGQLPRTTANPIGLDKSQEYEQRGKKITTNIEIKSQALGLNWASTCGFEP